MSALILTMNEDVGIVRGQRRSAWRSVLELLFFTGQVTSLEEACRSIPPPPKLNPLRAGSFIIWEPSIPIRSWERVRKCGNWWSVVSCQSCIFILRLRTSLLVLAAQECQIMDYLQVDLLIYFPSAPFYESSYEIIINISSVYWAPTIHHILFHLCCLLWVSKKPHELGSWLHSMWFFSVCLESINYKSFFVCVIIFSPRPKKCFNKH